MERRKLLQSIGSSTVIGTLGVSAASGSKGQFEDVNTEEYTGKKKKSVLRQAFNDSNVKSLHSELKSRGWSVNRGSLTASNIEPAEKSGSFDYVFAKLKQSRRGKADGTGRGNGGKERQAVLLWWGNDEVGLDLPTNTVAHIVERPFQSTTERTTSGLFGWEEITVLKPAKNKPSIQSTTANGNGVIETTTDFTEELDISQPETPEVGVQSHTYCTVDVKYTDSYDIDWWCIARQIGTAIGAAATCAGCVIDPSKGSCALCVLAYGMTLRTFQKCQNASSIYEGRVVDIKKDWLESNDIDCDDYHTSNYKHMPVDCDLLKEMPTRHYQSC